MLLREAARASIVALTDRASGRIARHAGPGKCGLNSVGAGASVHLGDGAGMYDCMVGAGAEVVLEDGAELHCCGIGDGARVRVGRGSVLKQTDFLPATDNRYECAVQIGVGCRLYHVLFRGRKLSVGDASTLLCVSMHIGEVDIGQGSMVGLLHLGSNSRRLSYNLSAVFSVGCGATILRAEIEVCSSFMAGRRLLVAPSLVAARHAYVSEHGSASFSAFGLMDTVQPRSTPREASENAYRGDPSLYPGSLELSAVYPGCLGEICDLHLRNGARSGIRIGDDVTVSVSLNTVASPALVQLHSGSSLVCSCVGQRTRHPEEALGRPHPVLRLQSPLTLGSGSTLNVVSLPRGDGTFPGLGGTGALRVRRPGRLTIAPGAYFELNVLGRSQLLFMNDVTIGD